MAIDSYTDLNKISSEEIQGFVFAHEHDDEKKLLLKTSKVLGLPAEVVADQIAGRRKARLKLPTWYRTRGVVYPPALNLSQSSSELTALYKAKELCGLWGLEAKRGVDLTGGLGIDSWCLGKHFNDWTFIEPNASLLAIAEHNHRLLGVLPFNYQSARAEDFLGPAAPRYDFAIIDPSRRADTRKVFNFRQCSPDLLKLLSQLKAKTSRFLIKASPMLDLRQGIHDLGCVSRVDVVAVQNECREVLFWCSPQDEGGVQIRCVNLGSGHDAESPFMFTLDEERTSDIAFSEPQEYLYEPDASILKAGAFKSIASRFNVLKIAPHTHLYTSSTLIADFPGRIFLLAPTDNSNYSKHFPDGKANIMTRNFPLSPVQIKKKYKLKDGGDVYLIGFSGASKKHLIPAKRVS